MNGIDIQISARSKFYKYKRNEVIANKKFDVLELCTYYFVGDDADVTGRKFKFIDSLSVEFRLTN